MCFEFGLCKFIGAGDKKSVPTEVPYISERGDIENLTSYPVPSASGKYVCINRINIYWDIYCPFTILHIYPN